MYDRPDTIAAIATGKGHAAIGIVRISGPRAGAVVDAVVPKARAAAKPRRVVAAKAVHPETKAVLDEVLCFHCPGPHTATGEDTAEIHGHGGPLVLNALLAAVIAAGASPARPGEFTYRAFRNGRLDLTQAEAVMELIGARSGRAAKLAVRHLRGGLGVELDDELADIIEVAARIEAGLDFPDDDLPVDDTEELRVKLRRIGSHLSELCRSFALGERINQGAKVAIVGPPNAGKSSLLNRLVGDDRALVDHEPGTTRDVVEARSEVSGIPVTFLDTAGLRAQSGRVESRGIEKTRNAAKDADLLVVVLDGTDGFDTARGEVMDFLESDRPVLAVLNKKDLASWQDAAPGWLGASQTVGISALTGEGIEGVRSAMEQLLVAHGDDEDNILTTARQRDAVASSLEYVERALRLLDGGGEAELAAADLRWARESLAALWGRAVSEDVIDSIFSTFCLGK